jgi:hypothetical protein
MVSNGPDYRGGVNNYYNSIALSGSPLIRLQARHSRRDNRRGIRLGSTTGSWHTHAFPQRGACVLPSRPNRSSGPPAGVSPTGFGRRLLENESNMGVPAEMTLAMDREIC